jgi:hypothetical protein
LTVVQSTVWWRWVRPLVRRKAELRDGRLEPGSDS